MPWPVASRCRRCRRPTAATRCWLPVAVAHSLYDRLILTPTLTLTLTLTLTPSHIESPSLLLTPQLPALHHCRTPVKPLSCHSCLQAVTSHHLTSPQPWSTSPRSSPVCTRIRTKHDPGFARVSPTTEPQASNRYSSLDYPLPHATSSTVSVFCWSCASSVGIRVARAHLAQPQPALLVNFAFSLCQRHDNPCFPVQVQPTECCREITGAVNSKHPLPLFAPHHHLHTNRHTRSEVNVTTGAPHFFSVEHVHSSERPPQSRP